MFKRGRQNKFNKLKTDEARIKFLMTELESDEMGRDSIWEETKGKYLSGSIWNPVIFDAKLFNKIKSKLERHQERETYTINYFWMLKGKY